MSNTCRLPSIRLLSLDLPLPGLQDPASHASGVSHQNGPQVFEQYYYPAPAGQAPPVYKVYGATTLPGHHLGNLGATPPLANHFVQGRAQPLSQGHPQPYDTQLLTPYHHPTPQLASGTAYSFQPAGPSRLSSSVASGAVHSDAETDLKGHHSPSAAYTQNTPPASVPTPAQTPPLNEDSPNGERASLTTGSSPSSPKELGWKPRKKRQCPECHLYFSNLATHKSTHLKPTSRPHLCKLCHRGFARPNDLFRHFKCHWKEIGADKGQFRCPFKAISPDSQEDHCCHTLGIFSRCDTYKNHLKAIHFQYPSGTKKSERNNVPGSCRLCNKQFDTVDDWIINHIDANECPFASH